jgi:hypothetical protein
MAHRKLVLVPGRAPRGKASAALRKEWLHALGDGLAGAGLGRTLDEADVRFAFYGDVLDAQTDVVDPAAEVVGGAHATQPERVFISAVMEEARKEAAITKAELAAIAGPRVMQKGPLHWEWVQAVIKAIDRHVPGGNGASIALAAHDVYQYLNNPAFAKAVDEAVRRALPENEESVVVSHSLGTVVAYNLLKMEGAEHRWRVPLFVTLGSPLAITAIRNSLGAREFPSWVGEWFNAMDERDRVAVYPLDKHNFNVEPAAIANKTDVDNPTENHHAAAGYLADLDVARRIGLALQ